VLQKEFLEDLGFFIVKTNLQIWFVENMWLKCLILCWCQKLNFPFKRQFSQEILLGLVEKTKSTICSSCIDFFFLIIRFDLWMSKGDYDVFALMINFLSID
jgi:hypothetical protein